MRPTTIALVLVVAMGTAHADRGARPQRELKNSLVGQPGYGPTRPHKLDLVLSLATGVSTNRMNPNDMIELITFLAPGRALMDAKDQVGHARRMLFRQFRALRPFADKPPWALTGDDSARRLQLIERHFPDRLGKTVPVVAPATPDHGTLVVDF